MLLIHKVAAAIMIISAIYHLGYLLYCWLVKKQMSTATLPTWKDVTDLLDHIIIVLDLRKRMQSLTVIHTKKFDYWAVFWVLPSWWDRTDDVVPHITAGCTTLDMDCAQWSQ